MTIIAFPGHAGRHCVPRPRRPRDGRSLAGARSLPSVAGMALARSHQRDGAAVTVSETTTGGDAPTTGRGRRHAMATADHGETAIDFWGRRRIWLAISLVLLAITGVSLIIQGLDLGIDFEGGVAWEVPASDVSSRMRRRSSTTTGSRATAPRSRRHVRERRHCLRPGRRSPDRRRVQLQQAFADRRRRPEEVAIKSVSASGSGDHREGSVALIIFLPLVAMFISLRFEWRMAVVGDHRHAARRRHQRRHLLGVQLRGHAGDRGRLPDHPRLLPLRHHRRVR